HAVENPQEGRLPASGGPDEGRHPAGRHGQRHTVQDLVVAEPGRDPARFEPGPGGGGLRMCLRRKGKGVRTLVAHGMSLSTVVTTSAVVTTGWEEGAAPGPRRRGRGSRPGGCRPPRHGGAPSGRSPRPGLPRRARV